MAQLSFDKKSRLSQAYIISAASEQERLAAARRVAAAALCEAEGTRPCGLCRHCRKAQAGIHPDITAIRRLVDEKTGKPKRDVSVQQIRQMAADASILPNEAACKVYVIEEAEYMNDNAQNAALKIFEEPPAWVVFVLCLPSAAALLPTVRSRCAEISCGTRPQEEDEESAKRVKDFVRTAATGDRAKILAWCIKNEAMDNRQAEEFFSCLHQYLADIMCSRQHDEGMDRQRLMGLLELCERCRGYLRRGTGVKHIFGLLAVKAPDAGRNKRTDN